MNFVNNCAACSGVMGVQHLPECIEIIKSGEKKDPKEIHLHCPKCRGVEKTRHSRGCFWSKDDSDALDGMSAEDQNKLPHEKYGLPAEIYLKLIIKNAKNGNIGRKMLKKFHK